MNEFAEGSCMINNLTHALNVLNDPQTAEQVIRIVTGQENLNVIKTAINYDKLDVFATDSTGHKYGIVIRIIVKGWSEIHDRIAYYNISFLDIPDEQRENMEIIFLNRDIYHLGYEKYTVNWVLGELSQLLKDFPETIYVNYMNQDSSSQIGKLVHDLRCVDTKEMYHEFLRKRTELIRATMYK